MILNEGKIIDASFTVAPRQRNTPEENKIIKKGKGDELWKNHAKIDTVQVADASVHDSQALEPLLTAQDEGQELHADSAYKGEPQEKIITYQ